MTAMGDRNANHSAAIMVAIWSALMLVCLMVVLTTNRSFSGNGWLGILWPLIAVVALIPLMRRASYTRIRRAIEGNGGRVLRIRRVPWWRQEVLEAVNLSWAWHGAKYEVEFVDILGTEHYAICRSSLLHGVEWLALK